MRAWRRTTTTTTTTTTRRRRRRDVETCQDGELALPVTFDEPLERRQRAYLRARRLLVPEELTKHVL